MASNTSIVTPDYAALADRLAKERRLVVKWEGADSKRAAQLAVQECAARVRSVYPDAEGFGAHLKEVEESFAGTADELDSIDVHFLSEGKVVRTITHDCECDALGDLPDILPASMEHQDIWDSMTTWKPIPWLNIPFALGDASSYALQAGFSPGYLDQPATSESITRFCEDFGFWGPEINEGEYRTTWMRRQELQMDPPPSSFDLAHLQGIHFRLFQDLYDRAGEIRTVELTKATSTFHPSSLLQEAAEHTFTWLAGSSLLESPSESQFVTEGAELLGMPNYMHPFREGNGGVK